MKRNGQKTYKSLEKIRLVTYLRKSVVQYGQKWSFRIPRSIWKRLSRWHQKKGHGQQFHDVRKNSSQFDRILSRSRKRTPWNTEINSSKIKKKNNTHQKSIAESRFTLIGLLKSTSVFDAMEVDNSIMLIGMESISVNLVTKAQGLKLKRSNLERNQ